MRFTVMCTIYKLVTLHMYVIMAIVQWRRYIKTYVQLLQTPEDEIV